jgi:hypothetical protein
VIDGSRITFEPSLFVVNLYFECTSDHANCKKLYLSDNLGFEILKAKTTPTYTGQTSCKGRSDRSTDGQTSSGGG